MKKLEMFSQWNRSNTDMCSTCFNSQSEWGAPRVATQSVQLDVVPGAWLQTLRKTTTTKNGKTSPKHQNHTSDFLKVC